MGWKNSVQRITILHHKVWGVMINGDPKGQIFYPPLAQAMDSVSCSTFNSAFSLKNKQETPESL